MEKAENTIDFSSEHNTCVLSKEGLVVAFGISSDQKPCLATYTTGTPELKIVHQLDVKKEKKRPAMVPQLSQKKTNQEESKKQQHD